MKFAKSLVSLLIVLSMFTFLSITNVSAASSPVELTVSTDRESCGYLGMINVNVTLKNNSSKAIKNVVITSSDSSNLCMYKPVDYNVVVKNPQANDLRKKNAMTTYLKSGGVIKYSYCVLLSYQNSKRLVPESTYKIMYNQHKMLKTLNFRPISIKSGSSAVQKKILTFGDVKALLNVTGYWNIDDSAYDTIVSGGTVSEERKVEKTTESKASSSDFRKMVDEFERFYKNEYLPGMNSDDPVRNLNVTNKYIEKLGAIDDYIVNHDISADDLLYWDAALLRCVQVT